MTTNLLKSLTRRQPFYLVVNKPLLLTIHRRMDEMAQLLVSFLEDRKLSDSEADELIDIIDKYRNEK